MKRTAAMKRKRRSIPAAEKRHIARVAEMPCLVSGERPVTVHHVSASIHGGRITRSDRRIVPLAARFHLIQHGPRESVEALSHRGFYERYGIDLLAVADKLWQDSVALETGFYVAQEATK